PLALAFRFVSDPYSVRQQQKAMTLAHFLGQLVLEIVGERQRSIDPGRDLLRREAFHQVVLRHEAADGPRANAITALEELVVWIAHLAALEAVTPDRPGHSHPIAAVQLTGHPQLVEPDDVQLIAGVVHERGLRQLQLLVPADLRRYPQDGADYGRERSVDQLRDRPGIAELLPAEGKLEQEVAHRDDPKRGKPFLINGLDLGQLGHRRVQTTTGV